MIKHSSAHTECLSVRGSVSSSDNMLYYGNVDGKIVALQVGTFATTAPATATASPTSTPIETEPPAPDSTPAPTESPTARPTDGEVFVTPIDSGNGDKNVQTGSSTLSDGTTKALFAISALVALLAISILAYVFISIRRRRQRKNSTLPLANQWNQSNKRGSGGADTGIPAEDTVDTFEGSKKRMKKKKSPSMSSEPSSHSRLAAIAEAPLEDASLEEGIELIDDDGEEEDIERYVFDYTETTPETSFSSSQSSSASPDKAARSTGAAIWADTEHARYVPEKAARAAGVDVAAVKSSPDVGMSRCSSSSESDCDPTDDDDVLIRGNRITSTGELIAVHSDGPRPYYMLDTRPEGAGAIMKVGGSQSKNPNCDGYIDNTPRLENCIPLTRRVALTPGWMDEMTPPAHIVNNKQPADGGTMIPVSHGSRSSNAVGTSATPLSRVRSDGTSSPVYIEDEQSTGHGIMVPIAGSHNRATYEIDPPALNTFAETPRDGSNSTSPTVQVENNRGNRGTAPEEAILEENREQARLALETPSNHRMLLMKKLGSMKSDGTLASIDEDGALAKQSAMVPAKMETTPTFHFEDQLSPCTSMYLEEDSTVATAATGDVTYESAPLDEKASRPHKARSQVSSTPPRTNVSPPVKTSSTLGPTPRRTNGLSLVGVASAKLDTISPLTVEKGDACLPTKKSPAFIFNAPLSPGSTIGSTSLYIEDDGSVELERDDDTNASTPLDEKYMTPASVKLDACSTPHKAEETSSTSPAQEIKKITVRKSYGNSIKARLSTARKAGPLSPKGVDSTLSPGNSNKTRLSASHMATPLTRRVVDSKLPPGAPKLSPPPPLSPTSTSTNESQSSSEAGNNFGRSPAETSEVIRSMRKMRLERMRGKKPDSSLYQKERNPENTTERFPASSYQRATLPQPADPVRRPQQNKATTASIPDGYSQTAGNDTISPSSPSVDSIKYGDPTISSESDTSTEEHPPPVRSISTARSEQPWKSVRDTSMSDDRKKQVKRRDSTRSAPTSRRSERKRSTSGTRPKKAERKVDAQPAVITSYFSGLMKHVEEAERQFFNPTLPPKKTQAKAASQRSDYEADSSDDESMPPPPPTYH